LITNCLDFLILKTTTLFHVSFENAIFDKDLEMYITTGKQESCLRYIAKYSPVSMNEVIEKFGSSTIQCLEQHRLVIRAGFNYTIYWDIFREYILEEKVPTIPLSYRPRNRIPTVLEIFTLITQAGTKGIKITELVSRAKQKQPTVKSIVLYLQNFCLVTCQQDNVKAQPELVNAADDGIAAHLARQLEEHIVIREVYDQLKPGKMMTLWGFQKIVAKAYSIEDSENKKTAQDYASRMLSWFLFAGLLEKQQNRLIFRPIGEGKQKGKPLDCVLSASKEDTELPLLKLLS
jgi:predicted transcriptional regulator